MDDNRRFERQMEDSKILHSLKTGQRKIRIYFDGWEPHITILSRPAENYRSTVERGLFDKFRKWSRQWGEYRKKKSMIKKGLNPCQCEGCGEGVAKWIIDEPNEALQNKLNPREVFVCDLCVNFYDQNISKRELPYEKIERIKLAREL